tara:strand:- start:1705 stop:1920 length:216 start_codon:yes stop_codon:yes gene_type:complete
MKTFLTCLTIFLSGSAFIIGWSFIWAYAHTPESLTAFILLGVAIIATIATFLSGIAASEYKAPRRARGARR